MYPYPDPRHPDEQRFERWLNEARAEATRITAKCAPLVMTVETGLWGVRITGAVGARRGRCTVWWAHVKDRTDSPFLGLVRLVAEALGAVAS